MIPTYLSIRIKPCSKSMYLPFLPLLYNTHRTAPGPQQPGAVLSLPSPLEGDVIYKKFILPS